MGGVPWGALQGGHDHLLDLGVGDRAWPARAGLIDQPVKALGDKAPAETARIDALIAKKWRMISLVRTRFMVVRINALDDPEDATLTPLRRMVSGVVAGAWGGEPGSDEQDVSCVRVADFDRARAETRTDVPTVRSLPTVQIRRLRLRAGDLLLEKSGGGERQPVGFVAAFREDTGQTAICSNFVARLRPAGGFDPGYLRHLFAAVYDAGLSVPHIKQTTGIQNLEIGSYLSQARCVASHERQRGIAASLDELLDQTIEAARKLSRQIELLREHRQALITAAVTGEVAIP